MIAYLDTSALAKLVLAEPESDPLLIALRAWPRRASSELARVELVRAVRRAAPKLLPRAEGVLSSLTLLRLTRELQQASGMLSPADMRSLDAIHLASAISLGEELAVMLCYDRRLLAAAGTAGVATLSPR